jgi:hypothetical protein
VVSSFQADPGDAVTPEHRRARPGTVKVSHLRCHIPAKIWNIGGVIHPTTRGEILPDDPDDPMRTAIRQVMGVFAQLDRTMTAKRMRNGRKAKAAASGYAGYGSPAFGQHSIDGEVADDQAEQAVIERMRELRGAGLPYRLIAARLNAEGLESKRGGTAPGDRLTCPGTPGELGFPLSHADRPGSHMPHCCVCAGQGAATGYPRRLGRCSRRPGSRSWPPPAVRCSHAVRAGRGRWTSR